MEYVASKEVWRQAFADAVRNAREKDDFSDILFFSIFPEHGNKAEDYEAMWKAFDKAFEDFFKEPYNFWEEVE